MEEEKSIFEKQEHCIKIQNTIVMAKIIQDNNIVVISMKH